VRSPGKEKHQQVVGKLPQIPLGTSNFYHTYGIEEKIYQMPTKKNHTQKGRDCGDTIKGILSSRTTSKSRFKVILGQHATKKGNLYTK
jgi:hypothetical protein